MACNYELCVISKKRQGPEFCLLFQDVDLQREHGGLKPEEFDAFRERSVELGKRKGCERLEELRNAPGLPPAPSART